MRSEMRNLNANGGNFIEPSAPTLEAQEAILERIPETVSAETLKRSVEADDVSNKLEGKFNSRNCNFSFQLRSPCH